MDGINDVLTKYPDIKVLHTQPADWDRNLAMQTMENWLQLESKSTRLSRATMKWRSAHRRAQDAGKEKRGSGDWH